MRIIVMFVLAMILGIVGTLVAMNAMNRQTPWSRATMTVIGRQMRGIDQNLKANRCSVADFQPKLQTLRAVANDIEPAFAEQVSDPQFNRYAADLRAAADTALASPPATCKAASEALTRLDKTCDSCHRDFRG